MKKFLTTLALVATAALTMANSGCSDASTVSSNLSQDADNFRVLRRIVFYNGFTNDYMLEVIGYCSMQPTSTSKGVAAVCKVGPESYKKHMLGLSDNVTYFAEQLEARSVSTNFYRVTFKPSVILPDFRLELGNDKQDFSKTRN